MDHLQTQLTLSKWGSWWRSHGDHLGYPRVNQIAAMMEVAKLGVRVQATQRVDRSEEIRVPAYIEEVDAAIARLSQRDRALLVYLYQRTPRWNRRTLQRKSPALYRALLRAELRIGADL